MFFHSFLRFWGKNHKNHPLFEQFFQESLIYDKDNCSRVFK